MKKLRILKEKFVYGIRTGSPLPWAMFFVGVYFTLLGLPSLNLFSSLPVSLAYLVFPVVIFLLPWVVALWLRWLPSSLVIPIPMQDEHPLNGKVIFSTSSIFDQPGDLILSYNRNNIAGGTLMMDGSRHKRTNLMGQFMHCYFGGEKDEYRDEKKCPEEELGENPLYFDWNLFLACYQSEETKVFCPSEQGGVKEIDKNSVPLKSAYSPHFKERPELEPSLYDSYADGALFPEGTVIALRLPKKTDSRDESRRYTFLLCNTLYHPEESASAESSLEMLDECLKSVWRVIAKTPGTNAQHVCVPFLGKGYSGLREHAYGVLWSIVFSYRKAFSGNANPNFGINICIPAEELVSRKIKLWEAARFLTYALRG